MFEVITPRADYRNTAFSTLNPFLQFAWDSTSLGDLKECPRKYYYSRVLGYSPKAESVHLKFGQLLHKGHEIYHHCRARECDHEEALYAVVYGLLELTWEKTPDGGGRPWRSDDKIKNRQTLLRTIVWYLDKFNLDSPDPLQTFILKNGKPAVELSFRFDFGLTLYTGDPVLLCGHWDRAVSFGNELAISDIKSTKSALDDRFFKQFNPHNQFSLYRYAGKVIWGETINRLIVDAAQIGVTFSAFLRQEILYSPEHLEEWAEGTREVIGRAEGYAARALELKPLETPMNNPLSASAYPMNEKSCGNYGGCPFRELCSKAPSVRPKWLTALYSFSPWDPLVIRGDI